MRRSIFLATCLLLAAQPIGLAAQPAPRPEPPSQAARDLTVAWTAAGKVARVGPADIALLDQGHLHIAADEAFVSGAEANQVMTALGNSASPGRFGLIVSRRKDVDWLVDVTWTKEGYVRDGDAKDWKPDELFQALKEGTDAGNAQRLARGIPALDLIGWIEPPTYDAVAHRLVWSLAAHDRGALANAPRTINYNTYALGREGYFSLDLITDSTTIGADKAVAKQLLGGLSFVPGKRYQDFNGSTDKVAAYGLAALVGVVAAKKLGLLALTGVFLLKVWKLGLLALAGAGAAVRRFFGRRRSDDQAQG